MLADDWLVGADGTKHARLGESAPQLVGETGSLVATGAYEAARHEGQEPGDYNFGGCVAEVAVDVETGEVTVLGVTFAVDVGTVINPIGHQGQLAGGFVFGLGGAVMEEMVVEDGRVVTLNLGDYKLPTSMDVPPLRTVLLPTSTGPGAYGAKMAGELTNSAVAPAIANAIADAIGVRLHALPLSAQRVHEAIKARDRLGPPHSQGIPGE